MSNEIENTQMLKIHERASSMDAISEIVGELENAKLEKRQPKIKAVYKEKSKQYFSRFRNEKLLAYFGGFVALNVLVFSGAFSGILFKNDDIFLYIIAYFVIFLVISYTYSEIGYIKKITSEKTTDEEKQICYYLFDFVPQFRTKLIIFSVVFFLLSATIGLFFNTQIQDFIKYIILVILILILPFFEFLYTTKVR